MVCSVCGEEACARHGGVLLFARLLNVCAFVGLALLLGLTAAALAVARA